MPISDKMKLAFCHVPRTGGYSICSCLNLNVIDKHYPASWYREHFPDYRLFAVWRSYENRIKSAYGWMLPDDLKPRFKDFDTFVFDRIRKGKKNGLMIKPNDHFIDCEVDYLLRFEHLQKDLDAMLIELGFDPIPLVQSNSFRNEPFNENRLT
jgi:hypothetical protein